VPRSFTASVRQLYQQAVEENPEAILKALAQRLKKGDHHHVRLAAEYLDGKPVQRVSVETPQQITFVLRPPEPKE
jgi:hypothetical protein